jgi:CBS domain-containing protein
MSTTVPGRPAADGLAFGTPIVLAARAIPDDAPTVMSVEEALRATAERFDELAEGAEAEGRTDEAEVLEAYGMLAEFFSLPEDATAQEAIRRLQHASDAEMVFYIYVTDKEDHLVGVLSLRQLLTVPPATPLKHLMTRDVISVAVDMDQEEVSRQVARYNLLAVPVVEKDQTLVGIITVDDVVDVIREEATEDMLKMAGAAEAVPGLNPPGVNQSMLICPPRRSCTASTPPLYATSTASILVMFFSISLERCETLPGPLVP